MALNEKVWKPDWTHFVSAPILSAVDVDTAVKAMVFKLILSGLFALFLALTTPFVAQAETLSAPDAYEMAKNGEIALIDVRSPSEWRETGLPAHGAAITIHDPGGIPAFVRKMTALIGDDLSRPVALICAAGVRSSYAEKLLREAGYTAVYNVREGMLGGRAGPGWLKRSLPTATFD